MSNYQQPNTDKPVNDPAVSILHKIVNVCVVGPVKPMNHSQPNTANPVVDKRVGTYTINFNPLGL